MKKLLALTILGTLCFAGCAQKEEKREDFKDNHSVEEKRNAGVPEDAMSDSAQVKDSMNIEKK